MNVLSRSPHFRSLVTAAVIVATALFAAGAAGATVLPNPCTLLTSAHVATVFGHGATQAVTKVKLQSAGSGSVLSETCSETVGAQPVAMGVNTFGAGGFGGFKLISQASPSGFGGHANLIIGASTQTGKPIDVILFHRGKIYVNLDANGANTDALTTLGRRIYSLLS